MKRTRRTRSLAEALDQAYIRVNEIHTSLQEEVAVFVDDLGSQATRLQAHLAQ